MTNIWPRWPAHHACERASVPGVVTLGRTKVNLGGGLVSGGDLRQKSGMEPKNQPKRPQKRRLAARLDARMYRSTENPIYAVSRYLRPSSSETRYMAMELHTKVCGGNLRDFAHLLGLSTITARKILDPVKCARLHRSHTFPLISRAVWLLWALCLHPYKLSGHLEWNILTWGRFTRRPAKPPHHGRRDNHRLCT